MKGIKNIIFDLGNVIIDLDIPKTERDFRVLLEDEFENAWQTLQRRDLFHQFETGKISEETFIWAIQQSVKKPLDPREIINAWNGMLLHIPPIRFDLLERLKARYRTFLYSNTNSIHLAWVYRYLKREYAMQDFETRFFEKAYYSHLIQMRKPDVEGYRFILQDAGILESETLFVDDNGDNIRGAQEAGLLTLHHEIGAEIAEVMKNF